MIKAIVFDWGGVLADNPAVGLMNYCADALRIDVKLLKSIFSNYETFFQKGEISEDKLWNNICNELKVKTSPAKSLWKNAVNYVLKDKKEIYQLISLLKKKGYLIGLITNTELPTMEYFLENGYEKYFDTTTFSCAENTVKPDQYIYDMTLSKLNVKPYESIFIDDNPENIEGAKKLGMNGILFETFELLVTKLAALDIMV